jgi:membrane-bound ClpP family serine protease
MNTKLVERTPDKLVLKVKSSSIFIGLFLCLIGVVLSLIGVLEILNTSGMFLSNYSFFLLVFNSSYSLLYILGLIVPFARIISGGFVVFGGIVLLRDATWTFDKKLRKLIIKKSKFLRTQFCSYEYSFDEIVEITTNLTMMPTMMPTSAKRKKSPMNLEKPAEIVNLIQNYLS